MKNRIAIFGSTGSIGRQTIDVVKAYPDDFDVVILTANINNKLLARQAKELKPNYVVLADNERCKELVEELSDLTITVLCGYNEIVRIAKSDEYDIALMAMVGYSALLPTVAAIEAKKKIALANKEALVVAGEIIMQKVAEKDVELLPVDSEHSAIFQCLEGEDINTVEKIYLTASGGPFRGFTFEQLKKVTVKEALRHPNWNMGGKITIDSATMFNKGLEMIEAKWLFNLKSEQIDVIVHPQSIVHSLVQFEDASIKAQMGLPDMRLPILYALSYPKRRFSPFHRFSFLDYPELTFEYPDYQVFRSLKISQYALKKGGNIPCIMNAANEVAVKAFLRQQIVFTDIFNIVEKTIESIEFKENLQLEEYIEFDKKSREIALKQIK